MSGGLTISYLIFCCIVTLILYLYMFSLLLKPDKPATVSWNVLKRGLTIILALLLTWILWAIAGAVNYAGRPFPVRLEIFAALLIVFQPIIDFWLILKIPAVRNFLGSRAYSIISGKYISMDQEKTQANSQAGTKASGSIRVTGKSESGDKSVVEMNNV
jgi:hypothetical protein